ncbi:MAG: MBL fold metallo-hydrolase [Solirubrobacterales bacterium]|nr:MBL fold metallo-hydrolase [Solirubrobacterales bacterium]
MIFRQITHDDLGCASYLIGDEHAGVAAVVDPRFEIDEYLDLARYMGVSIEHIFETHNHADHVSGHGRLAAATGATIHIHRAAEPEYAHEPLQDGDEFTLGRLTVRALHTPGHRPEHTSFALIDTRRGEEPWAVLCGDTLFVGDVARPDLAIEKSDGARGIFRSLRTKLLSLPAEVEVWPGHLGGSMCGGPGMDMKISSTIGFERDHNPTLAIADEEAFVAEALAKLGPQPPNLEAIVALNRGPLVTDAVELLPLAPRQVEEQRRAGALLVDVRTDQQFDDAHIEDAVCNPMLRAGFGSKLAWIADRDQEVVFVGRDDEDGRRAGRLAVAIGVRRLAGYLHGGMTSWRQERRPVLAIERVAVGDLLDRRRRRPELQVLDVRDRHEWEAGYLPGSLLQTWHDITALPEGLDPDAPVAVICASGQRAATAASLVRRLGAREVIHVVDGGVPTLAELGVALATGPRHRSA